MSQALIGVACGHRSRVRGNIVALPPPQAAWYDHAVPWSSLVNKALDMLMIVPEGGAGAAPAVM